MTKEQANAIERIVISLNCLTAEYSEHKCQITVTQEGENRYSAIVDCYITSRLIAFAAMLNDMSILSFKIDETEIKIY